MTELNEAIERGIKKLGEFSQDDWTTEQNDVLGVIYDVFKSMKVEEKSNVHAHDPECMFCKPEPSSVSECKHEVTGVQVDFTCPDCGIASPSNNIHKWSCKSKTKGVKPTSQGLSETPLHDPNPVGNQTSAIGWFNRACQQCGRTFMTQYFTEHTCMMCLAKTVPPSTSSTPSPSQDKTETIVNAEDYISIPKSVAENWLSLPTDGNERMLESELRRALSEGVAR